MFDVQLFLSFPLNDFLLSQFNQLPQALRDSFIQKGDTELYLRQIEYKGVMHVGKGLGPLIDMEALKAMQHHLLSVFQRLFPGMSCSVENFILLTIPVVSSEPIHD